jgi:uncharacterized membrane protein YhfC
VIGFRRWRLTALLIVAVWISGCAAVPPQPLEFGAPPWTDGETSTYDVQDRNGALLGTATWQIRQASEGWSQSYALSIAGRPDRGEVVLGNDLRPVRSWRENAAGRVEAEYSQDSVEIRKSSPGSVEVQTETLPGGSDVLDNDEVLQVQRALPLAQDYPTRYVNVEPLTATALDSAFRVIAAETVSVPAGEFPAWRAEMRAAGSVHDVWYGRAAPYPLLKYRNRTSGAVFLLRELGVRGAAGSLEPPTVATAQYPAINAPLLLATVFIQLPLMLVFPVLLGWWIRRRYGPGWGIFVAGALTFIASQVVHLPLNWALGLLGGGRGVATWPLVPMALVAGLSAALCEEGARWVVLTFFLKRVRTWAPGLQYGAGHGGGEAIIFGLLVLVNLVTMLVLPSMQQMFAALPPETAELVRYGASAYWATPWYMPIVGGMERVFAITLQIAMALLVVRSVAERQVKYLLAAIGIHAAVDAYAVWGMQTLGIFGTELGLAMMALGAFWLIRRLRGPMTPPEAPTVLAVHEPAQPLAPRELSTEELIRRVEASKYE